MIKWKINPLEELKRAGVSSYRLRQEKLLGQGTISALRAGIVPGLETVSTVLNLTGLTIGEALEHEPDETGKE